MRAVRLAVDRRLPARPGDRGGPPGPGDQARRPAARPRPARGGPRRGHRRVARPGAAHPARRARAGRAAPARGDRAVRRPGRLGGAAPGPDQRGRGLRPDQAGGREDRCHRLRGDRPGRGVRADRGGGRAGRAGRLPDDSLPGRRSATACRGRRSCRCCPATPTCATCGWPAASAQVATRILGRGTLIAAVDDAIRPALARLTAAAVAAAALGRVGRGSDDPGGSGSSPYDSRDRAPRRLDIVLVRRTYRWPLLDAAVVRGRAVLRPMTEIVAAPDAGTLAEVVDDMVTRAPLRYG